MSEQVNHPSHYGGDTPYEAVKVIEEWGLGFHLGNALKYIRRAGVKSSENKEQDIRKAIWYLEREISPERLVEGGRGIVYGLSSHIPPSLASKYKLAEADRQALILMLDEEAVSPTRLLTTHYIQNRLRGARPDYLAYKHLIEGDPYGGWNLNAVGIEVAKELREELDSQDREQEQEQQNNG